MIRNYLLIFFTLLTYSVNAQIPWSWVQPLNGSSSQMGPVAIAADPVSGFYASGYFSGTRNFGTYTLTSLGYSDAFLARYDNLGNVTWAYNYGSSISTTVAKAAAVDGNGNIYFAGTFTDTMTIGGITLDPHGVVDMFLIKVNPTGNVLWAKSLGGQGLDNATSIAIDNQNNVYLGGSYFFKAYFDNDSIGNNVTNEQIFIAKFSPGGQLQWLTDAGGSQDDACTGLSISANRLYMSGVIIGSCTFGSNNVVAVNADAFIAKYSLSGTNLWVKKAGGPQNDLGKGLGTDMYGNAYLAGTIFQNASFGNGITINAGNFEQLFIARYDSSGNCVWAKKGGNPSVPNIIGGIATDINGYSILIGSFKGTANFSPYNLSSSGQEDACFVKYSPSGTCQYALKGSGAGIEYGYSGAWLPSNEFALSGSFQNTANFGSITINTPAATTYANFIGLVTGATAGLNTIEFGNLTYGPNPVTNTFHINTENLFGIKTVEVFNSMGQLVARQNVINHNGNFDVNMQPLPEGFYTVKLNGNSSFQSIKIQKVN